MTVERSNPPDHAPGHKPDWFKGEPCPVGGEHDTSRPIYGPLQRATLAQALDEPYVVGAREIIGYSCNKCHKTWDKDWVATWDEMKP